MHSKSSCIVGWIRAKFLKLTALPRRGSLLASSMRRRVPHPSNPAQTFSKASALMASTQRTSSSRRIQVSWRLA